MAATKTIRVQKKGTDKKVVINQDDFNPEIHTQLSADEAKVEPAVQQVSGTLEHFPPRVSPEGIAQALEDPVGYDGRSGEPSDRVRLRKATPAPLAPSANPPLDGVSRVRLDPDKKNSPATAVPTSTATGARPGSPAEDEKIDTGPSPEASTEGEEVKEGEIEKPKLEV